MIAKECPIDDHGNLLQAKLGKLSNQQEAVAEGKRLAEQLYQRLEGLQDAIASLNELLLALCLFEQTEISGTSKVEKSSPLPAETDASTADGECDCVARPGTNIVEVQIPLHTRKKRGSANDKKAAGSRPSEDESAKVAKQSRRPRYELINALAEGPIKSYCDDPDWQGCHSLTPTISCDIILDCGPFAPTDKPTMRHPGPKYISQVAKFAPAYLARIIDLRPPVYKNFLANIMSYCSLCDALAKATPQDGTNLTDEASAYETHAVANTEDPNPVISPKRRGRPRKNQQSVPTHDQNVASITTDVDVTALRQAPNSNQDNHPEKHLTAVAEAMATDAVKISAKPGEKHEKAENINENGQKASKTKKKSRTGQTSRKSTRAHERKFKSTEFPFKLTKGTRYDVSDSHKIVRNAVYDGVEMIGGLRIYCFTLGNSIYKFSEPELCKHGTVDESKETV